jgi:hypothetical protein
MVLIAGQYVRGNWYSGSESDGQGYSFNADFRPIDDWAIFGRYDRWAPDRSQGTWNDRNLYIGGIAWTMNRYVKWILSGIMADYSGGSDPRSEEYLKYMLTAEVKW